MSFFKLLHHEGKPRFLGGLPNNFRICSEAEAAPKPKMFQAERSSDDTPGNFFELTAFNSFF